MVFRKLAAWSVIGTFGFLMVGVAPVGAVTIKPLRHASAAQTVPGAPSFPGKQVTHVGQQQLKPRVSVGWHWWGLQVKFSRSETNYVAWSAGAAAVYYSWTGVVALAAYVGVQAAQWASSHGYCLAVNVYWSGWYSPTAAGC